MTLWAAARLLGQVSLYGQSQGGHRPPRFDGWLAIAGGQCPPYGTETYQTSAGSGSVESDGAGSLVAVAF